MAATGLNVIALVSGGKDSFFSLLHCRANGHRIVALANLHPPLSGSSSTTAAAPAPAASAVAAASGSEPSLSLRDGAIKSDPSAVDPGDLARDQVRGHDTPVRDQEDEEDEHDLNSFMYQTVGHQVIPLYSEATGIPLYRREITGSGAQHSKYYSHHARNGDGTNSGGTEAAPPEPDETESMVPLLREIMAAHPEANAICAGAILSTYQRTRVESVATRLGLVPLAYLWNFETLPRPPLAAANFAQLLCDMAAVGLEARIIKVASGGLDESFLWASLASPKTNNRVLSAMRRFGTLNMGATIGEGGEFETLVLDGPSSLFRKRIVVAEEDRRVVREGGGSAWLMMRNARLEDKQVYDAQVPDVRIPPLLSARFLLQAEDTPPTTSEVVRDTIWPWRPQECQAKLQHWYFVRGPSSNTFSVAEETNSVVEQIRNRLQQANLLPSSIINTTILLRSMADFPTVNTVYEILFDAPNPPSRVTISCGDLLSPDRSINIAVFMTVHSSLLPGERQGLHVQSRSYWAPANIGPYSQAISIDLASLTSTRLTRPFSKMGIIDDDYKDMAVQPSPKLVTIAGQIPLVPATMAFPSEGGHPLQISLALQHLFRIAEDTGVQWFSSAMAFFPATSDDIPMSQKARLASKAWESAHLWTSKPDSDSDSEDEAGPDIWDRTYNYVHQSFGTPSQEDSLPCLPDWDVLDCKGSKAKRLPPLFVAEVASLPRGAGVEWQAHAGLAKVSDNAVSVGMDKMDAIPVLRNDTDGVEIPVSIWHCSMAGSGLMWLQTIVAEIAGTASTERLTPQDADDAASMTVRWLCRGDAGGKVLPVVRYVAQCGAPVPVEAGAIPCRSLWDGQGRQLASVTVYQTILGSGDVPDDL